MERRVSKVADGAGLVVLLGSGETTASGRRIFDWLLRQLPTPVRLAILETPAGFELNSAQVAGQIGDFMRKHLQNYHPQVTIVPARKRGTPLDPDQPDIAALIRGSDLILLGPGSPTYAVRQLEDSLTWYTAVACHRLGAALVLSSAATIAASAWALPVYEIYKVGEDLHWRAGLDFFAAYGLSLVLVPHWNNQDGGADLDTSRCYVGRARFEPLLEMLPTDATVVGIDERTALVLDLEAEACQVLGPGSVTVVRDGNEQCFGSKVTFPLNELGPFRQPGLEFGLPARVWEEVRRAHARAQADAVPTPSREVMALVERRERARGRRQWRKADALRDQIAHMGWQVLDTPDGPRLESVDQQAG
ncbi:MAG: cysteinyl-tRNA synthetase [Anaerolineae bacterium]